MKRWSAKEKSEVERPDVDRFVEEIAAVCKKHGFDIGHEDGHGAFIIEKLDPRAVPGSNVLHAHIDLDA